MNKKIYLSLACLVAMNAAAQDLGKIEVSEKANNKVIMDVSAEEIKSADLAEALSKNIPSVSIVRRSGIANDIILRGQKKDNINILIDDAKIYGACPNRMDPPTSHVLSNNIESVKVIEGPYDVENFGTLSGLVQVKTKEPTKDLKGDINFNLGSFGYRKASATISGGTDRFKLLLSTSVEKGDQYEDGNGNDFRQQQINKAVNPLNQYAQSDDEAFEKKTLLGKAIVNINDDSEIDLSYTLNRSDNVLYPNTPMDADYDDSDIYTIGYTTRNLSNLSKELSLDYYYSKVDHPMSTKLRNNGKMMYMTNYMESSIWGTKIKNSMEISDSLLTVGLDTSKRNWEGVMSKTTVATGVTVPVRTTLASTDTTNKAIFAQLENTFGNLLIESGARYDYTDIESEDSSKTDRNYKSLNANIFATYKADADTKYFAGIGKSSRVPDARELYYGSTNNNLDDTKNYEVDLGVEKNIGNFNIKTKLFYSNLEDYIYNIGGTFTNIDAKIYGLDISGYYIINDSLSFDYGLSYQRGKKDGNFVGTDRDLAEITPLKTNIALNYELNKAKFTAEVVAVDRWDNYDDSALEQELAGYALVNLKYTNQIHKNFGFTVGIDNVLDKTYSSTNTYQDVTYVVTGGERVLLNDPGRYGYVNLKVTF